LDVPGETGESPVFEEDVVCAKAGPVLNTATIAKAVRIGFMDEVSVRGNAML